jgi:hypothetical protein
VAINVNGRDGLITLFDQPGLLQIIELVPDSALGKTGVLGQGRGGREGTCTVRTGVVGKAQQHVTRA